MVKKRDGKRLDSSLPQQAAGISGLIVKCLINCT